jgi:hypothetical protein
MQWKMIQKGGVYFLWAYPFSVYWWNLFYYPYIEGYSVPELHDYLFYWAGFLAFAMRIAAWGKVRRKAINKNQSVQAPDKVIKTLGVGLVALGLVASATGHYWFDSVSAIVSGPEWSAELSLWLPFWPLEPFMPLIIMGLGALLITKAKIVVQSTASSI